MSWNTVDIGEEEYPGQASGCSGWGPCGHDHGQERPSAEDYSSYPEHTAYTEPPVRLPPAEPWPDYGRCVPTRRDIYPTEALAQRRIDDIRMWCAISGRMYLPLRAVECEHTDLPLHPGTHYHLRRVK